MIVGFAGKVAESEPVWQISPDKGFEDREAAAHQSDVEFNRNERDFG